MADEVHPHIEWKRRWEQSTDPESKLRLVVVNGLIRLNKKLQKLGPNLCYMTAYDVIESTVLIMRRDE